MEYILWMFAVGDTIIGDVGYLMMGRSIDIVRLADRGDQGYTQTGRKMRLDVTLLKSLKRN